MVCTKYVSLVHQRTKIIKSNISTVHGPVDCCVGLIPRDVVVGVESRRSIRTGLIERH